MQEIRLYKTGDPSSYQVRAPNRKEDWILEYVYVYAEVFLGRGKDVFGNCYTLLTVSASVDLVIVHKVELYLCWAEVITSCIATTKIHRIQITPSAAARDSFSSTSFVFRFIECKDCACETHFSRTVLWVEGVGICTSCFMTNKLNEKFILV
jgi:hypothetical protein